MKFVRAIAGYNHLWAVRDEAKEADELTMLFREWSNANYLLDFFLANIDDLQGFFHVEKISDAIKDTMEDARALERLILDFPYTEQLDGLFHPLSLADNRIHELTREKVRNWDREHTQIELDKLNACRNYLQQNGIFDKDSFVDFFEEDLL